MLSQTKCFDSYNGYATLFMSKPGKGQRRDGELTDKELMIALACGQDKSVNPDEDIKLEKGEEFVEIDGVKTIPFSLKADLEKAKFDDKGNLVASDTSDYSSVSYDEEEEKEDPDAAAKMAAALRKLLPLMAPHKTVNEAIFHCGDDGAKMAQITDLATELMLLGRSKIYVETVEKLTKVLESL